MLMALGHTTSRSYAVSIHGWRAVVHDVSVESICTNLLQDGNNKTGKCTVDAAWIPGRGN